MIGAGFYRPVSKGFASPLTQPTGGGAPAGFEVVTALNAQGSRETVTALNAQGVRQPVWARIAA